MKKVETQRVQLVCPKCKHEFKYDDGYINNKINELGLEIKNIQTQLAHHRTKSKADKLLRTEWYFKTKDALSIKEKQLLELKTIKKTAKQFIDSQEYQIFKEIVKEKFGKEAFMECIALLNEEMKPYNVASTAKTNFSRADGKNIISVNNL